MCPPSYLLVPPDQGTPGAAGNPTGAFGNGSQLSYDNMRDSRMDKALFRVSAPKREKSEWPHPHYTGDPKHIAG